MTEKPPEFKKKKRLKKKTKEKLEEPGAYSVRLAPAAADGWTDENGGNIGRGLG